MIRTVPFVPLIGAADFLNCLSDALVGWLHIKMANAAVKVWPTPQAIRTRPFIQGRSRVQVSSSTVSTDLCRPNWKTSRRRTERMNFRKKLLLSKKCFFEK